MVVLCFRWRYLRDIERRGDLGLLLEVESLSQQPPGHHQDIHQAWRSEDGLGFHAGCTEHVYQELRWLWLRMEVRRWTVYLRKSRQRVLGFKPSDSQL